MVAGYKRHDACWFGELESGSRTGQGKNCSLIPVDWTTILKNTEQTQPVILAHVGVNPIGPQVDVTLASEVTSLPLFVLIDPALLEPTDGVGRQTFGLLTDQRRECLLEIA